MKMIRIKKAEYNPRSKLHGFVKNKNGIISYYYKICKKIQGGNPTPFYNNEGANNIGTFTDTINDEKVFGKQVELNNPQIDSPIFEVLNALLLDFFIKREKDSSSNTFPNTMRFVDINTDKNPSEPIFFYTHVQGKTLVVKKKSKLATFSKFIRNLRTFGNIYGFSHNDLHMSNVMYSNETKEFTMIDYGSCHFHLKINYKIDINTEHLHKYLIQDSRLQNIQHNKSFYKYYNDIVSKLSNYKSFFMADINKFKLKKPIEFDISSICMGIYENFYDISENKESFPIQIHRGNYIPQLQIYNKWVVIDEQILKGEVKLNSNIMFQTNNILKVIESGVNFLIEFLRFKNYKSSDSILKHGIYASWTFFDQEEKSNFLQKYETMSGGYRNLNTISKSTQKIDKSPSKLEQNRIKSMTTKVDDDILTKVMTKQNRVLDDDDILTKVMTNQKYEKTPAFLYNTTQKDRTTWTNSNIQFEIVKK